METAAKTQKLQDAEQSPKPDYYDSSESVDPAVTESRTISEDWGKSSEVRSARERLEGIYDTAHPAAQRLIEKKRDEEPLGAGAEKVVYAHGDKKVLAFLTERKKEPNLPDRMKESFYISKILHLLLPENIPDIHLAGSQPAVMVAERINPPDNYGKRILSRLKKPFAKALLVHRIHKLGVFVDTFPSNFMLNSSGKPNYIDSFIFSYSLMSGKLERALQDLPDAERQKGRRYVERLKQLEATKK